MQILFVEPRWDAPRTPFRHTWEGLVNIDQFRWLVRRDVQDHLALAARELGARHVRAVGMFDDELRVLAADPTRFRQPDRRAPRLNWQVLDYIWDSLLERGVQPMFTTTFTPGAMASGDATCFETRARVSPPRDLDAWEDLVRAAVRHFTGRYGTEFMRTVLFEVWNEPNLRGFWDADQQAFHRLWARTWRAVKSVDPAYRVGGPSTARAEWLADLLAFGRANGCEPDYLITHIYNNDSESNPLSPFDGPQEDRIARSPHFAAGVVRGTRRLLDELGFRGEVHWNEWGRSWFPHDPPRETANEAAFCAKTMAEVSQLADRFAYWCLSDVYDQVGYGAEAFHGNYGLLSLHGLRKPAYRGFQLLGRLGAERVPADGRGPDPCAGAVATAGDAARVLVYRFAPEPAAAADALDVRVRLPRGTRSDGLRLTLVTETDNNILRAWEAMGRPACPAPAQLRELRAADELRAAPPGAVALEPDPAGPVARFALRGPGVALMEAG